MEGICNKCQRHYFGWSLVNADRQKCGQCGGPLEIVRDGVIHPEEIQALNHKKPTNWITAFAPSTWKS
jgi:PHP family Zn ribbon phosphoesterase